MMVKVRLVVVEGELCPVMVVHSQTSESNLRLDALRRDGTIVTVEVTPSEYFDLPVRHVEAKGGKDADHDIERSPAPGE